MTDRVGVRTIALFLDGSTEAIWAVKDTLVPLVNDQIAIDMAHGKTVTYTVTKRTWATAKQGESSFERVHLTVKEVGQGADYDALNG